MTLFNMNEVLIKKAEGMDARELSLALEVYAAEDSRDSYSFYGDDWNKGIKKFEKLLIKSKMHIGVKTFAKICGSIEDTDTSMP